jgi:hypothetical protein
MAQIAQSAAVPPKKAFFRQRNIPMFPQKGRRLMGVKNRDFGLTNCVVGVFRYQILHNIGASLFAVSSNTRKVISILPDETGTKAHIFAQGDSPDFQHHAPMTVSSAYRRACLGEECPLSKAAINLLARTP